MHSQRSSDGKSSRLTAIWQGFRRLPGYAKFEILGATYTWIVAAVMLTDRYLVDGAIAGGAGASTPIILGFAVGLGGLAVLRVIDRQ